MTCDEMIALFQELGAADAVNLDGGGSSTMWLQGPGVVNFPSDGSARVVANHLAIRATGSGAAPHCPLPAFAASFVGASAPTEMVAGEEVVTWMELRNDGRATWDLDLTRIGTQAPQDRASPFFKEGNWLGPNRPTGADHSNYGPGAVGRFSWIMRAPEVTEPTLFEETFQPLQEGVTWFGAPHTMAIMVYPRPTEPTIDAGVDGGDGDGDGDGGVAGDDPGGSSGGCAAGGASGGGTMLALAALLLRRRSRSAQRMRR